MQYLTGMLAFGVPCELDTSGKWNFRKEDFLNEELFKVEQSDESVLKDFGIETNKIVPYRPLCTYNVANHVRAYLDIMVSGEFDLIKDCYSEYIGNVKHRQQIFFAVRDLLRNTKYFKSINEFLYQEFGRAWHSYLETTDKLIKELEASTAEYNSYT